MIENLIASDLEFLNSNLDDFYDILAEKIIQQNENNFQILTEKYAFAERDIIIPFPKISS